MLTPAAWLQRQHKYIKSHAHAHLYTAWNASVCCRRNVSAYIAVVQLLVQTSRHWVSRSQGYMHTHAHTHAHTHTQTPSQHILSQSASHSRAERAPDSEAVNLAHVDMYLWMAYTQQSCWADQSQITFANNSQCLFFPNGEPGGRVDHISLEVNCQTPAEKYFDCICKSLPVFPPRLISSCHVNSLLPPKYMRINHSKYSQMVQSVYICMVPLWLWIIQLHSQTITCSTSLCAEHLKKIVSKMTVTDVQLLCATYLRILDLKVQLYFASTAWNTTFPYSLHKVFHLACYSIKKLSCYLFFWQYAALPPNKIHAQCSQFPLLVCFTSTFM